MPTASPHALCAVAARAGAEDHANNNNKKKEQTTRQRHNDSRPHELQRHHATAKHLKRRSQQRRNMRQQSTASNKQQANQRQPTANNTRTSATSTSANKPKRPTHHVPKGLRPETDRRSNNETPTTLNPKQATNRLRSRVNLSTPRPDPTSSGDVRQRVHQARGSVSCYGAN